MIRSLEVMPLSLFANMLAGFLALWSLSAVPVAAEPEVDAAVATIEGSTVWAKNLSGQDLRCRKRKGDGWGVQFVLPAGREIAASEMSVEVLYILCHPPVRRLTYRLSPGVRNVFVWDSAHREIELRSVTAGD